MTIVLIAAGFFALGLTVILLFRKTIRADDELDRRWAEVVAQRAQRDEPQPPPERSGRMEGSGGTRDASEVAEDGRPG